MTLMTNNNSDKLKQTANIYDLPLLLQVPGYKLQITEGLRNYFLVREVAFQKNVIVVRTDEDKMFLARLGDDACASLEVRESPNTLVFDYRNDTGTRFVWTFCLVPDVHVHPDILQAIRQAKGEED